MSDVFPASPHPDTMRRLDETKRFTPEGVEYWLGRELGPVLGYQTWAKFEPVIQRAEAALRASGQNPSHHIVQTGTSLRRDDSRDYFLSRGASYLIAMNGDSSKVEIATAQIYFAARTRQAEVESQLTEDQKRLELREKVATSVRRVSGAAKEAGVATKHQGIFHEQRYRGLYNASSKDVKRSKGLKPADNLFDHAGPLELSANDFQMNLAADILAKENIRSESAAVAKNLEVAQHVRRTIKESGGTLPEHLPLAEPIGEVRKRVTGRKTKAIPKPK
ncbi:MAG: hypothetical protein Q7T19_11705 [Caulobacter sp.]|nr:hypothetical protein [Caulobacter sp.]